MKFRNWDKEYDKPYHNGKQWMYDKTPIYDNILDCFLETQRPEGDKGTREKYGMTRLRDPFRKINKYKIQQYLGHMEQNKYKEVDWDGGNGRLSGYNLVPLDINGDGRTDIIEYNTVTHNESSIPWIPTPDGTQTIKIYNNIGFLVHDKNIIH